ncbi:MAG: TonB-dependent receptor domain-containing protein [Bernardetiaceae bacterium]
MALAQPGGGRERPIIQLKGRVLDDQNDKPLEYATVQVFSRLDSNLIGGGITDPTGVFLIDVPIGRMYVQVSFIGYRPQTIAQVPLERGIREVDLGVIRLAPDMAITEDVEIVAERMEMELSLDKRVFNVGQNSTLKGGNALDVLETLPSVEVDVEGNVALRGSGNVRILIDGRPSGLAGVGSSEALRLLQSDLVERVEVITNPSARYEAEGEAGIINIILRKDRDRGLNGSVDISGGYFLNGGIAANLNYRGKKANYFGSLGSQYRKSPGSGYFLQRNLGANGEPTAIFERDREQMRGGLNNTLRAGMDIFLDKRSTLTISGLVRLGDRNNEVDIIYRDFDLNQNPIQTTTRSEDESEDAQTYELSINYEKDFEQRGRKWTADMRWIKADERELADFTEQIQDGNSPLIVQRSSNAENEENLLFQTDYIHPFGQGYKFETGSRINFRTIDNDYLVEQQNENNVFEIFEDFNDRLVYQENIYAAYGIVSHKGQPFSWQLGLRAEFTDISVTSRESAANIQKSYLNLFPSVNASYALDKSNTVQLSYSRRLSRPRFRLLLPFSNFTDSRNLYEGNPDLDPEYTDSFEGSYLTYWESGSFLGSVYYRYRTNVIERVLITNEQGVSLVFPINLATQDAYGLEFSFSQNITKWWRIGTNFNFFRAITKGSYQERNLDNDTYAWTNNLNTKINLPNGINLQANFIYSSPRRTSQGEQEGIGFLNLGASKDVLNKRGTLTLSIRDAFSSRKRIVDIVQQDFTRYDEFQWSIGTGVLTFNYRFGKQESNQKRRRQIRDEDRSGGGDGV